MPAIDGFFNPASSMGALNSTETSTESAGPRPFLERGWLVLLLCQIVAFATYATALGNGFYNDDSTFLNDAKLLQFEPWKVFTISPLGWYRPLWSGYVLAGYALFGLNPAPWFAAGIAIHGFTGFLLWKLARAMRISNGGALVAAFTFITFFSHCEATLWMAAHNSSMVATMAIGAMLTNFAAIERNSYLQMLWTGLLVAAALLTKETGVTVLAWVPLAELSKFGWRSFFNKKAILRYALIAAAVVLFLSQNQRMREAASAQEVSPMASRAGVRNITVERVTGAFLFLFSPSGVITSDLNAWAGAGAIAVFFVILLILRRDLWATGAFAILGALVALVPTSTPMLQMGTPYRLYYFATVGGAVCIALLYECVRGRGARTAFAVVILGYCAWNAWWVWAMNLRFYQPFSLEQTECAKQMGKYLPENRPARIVLLEPPINNIFHLQRFLSVYHGVREDWVERHLPPPGTEDAFLNGKIRSGAVVLQFDKNGGLQPATAWPVVFDRSFSEAVGRGRREPPLTQHTAYTIRWAPSR